MPDLIEKSPEATAWMKEVLAVHAKGAAFDRVASSVIWSNATDSDGALLVPVDPFELAAKINDNPFPLLLRHDPGRPMGKVLVAKVFENSSGEIFVAAMLGLYESALKLGFGALGLDVLAEVQLPTELPALPHDLRFEIGADAREIDLETLYEIAREAPIPTDVQRRSHNAAEATLTLLQVSIPYMVLVWNPFIKAFATEAGKDSYAAVRYWLKKLSARLAKYQDPIVELQSTHEDCHVSFLVRGQNIARNYKALDALDGAAKRAAHLIAQMGAAGFAPVRLVYEFLPDDDLWYPSFAELKDGRLVTDNAALIAVENIPLGLSLGIVPASLAGPTGDDA
ncbi:hypothetical protein [Sphingomonas sp. R86520]|uniref:hypothetical protein n=1 Tax=Sphingomonas sp. R86520 TaxID=3093859 RepID=UPI0036D34296